MLIMHFFTFVTLLLTLILAITREVSSAPAYDDLDGYGQYSFDTNDRYDDDYYLTYRNRPVRRSYDDVDNLKRGYYYIDNGSITPVSSSDALTVRRPRAEQRRQDNLDSTSRGDNLPDGVKFRPVVRYRQTKAKKHKKLFVPNFFG